jgi:hypothetical protein
MWVPVTFDAIALQDRVWELLLDPPVLAVCRIGVTLICVRHYEVSSQAAALDAGPIQVQ